jgi:hypothetical protein
MSAGRDRGGNPQIRACRHNGRRVPHRSIGATAPGAPAGGGIDDEGPRRHDANGQALMALPAIGRAKVRRPHSLLPQRFSNPNMEIVMFCLPGCLRTFVFVLLLVLLPLSEASAHCFVGARFFPATLATDDPCVADEMSLPTVAWSRTGDIPPATQWAVSIDVSQGTFIPQVFVYGASLQYSMPYLKSEVKDLQLPDFINHLIPIVETQLATPVANNFGNSFFTTGTVNPGVIWVGSYFQVCLEAVIPVNGASGRGVGFLGQLHLYLNDIFPTTYGQPLIGGTSTLPRKLTF